MAVAFFSKKLDPADDFVPWWCYMRSSIAVAALWDVRIFPYNEGIILGNFEAPKRTRAKWLD
jgi:hypothetical protein